MCSHMSQVRICPLITPTSTTSGQRFQNSATGMHAGVPGSPHSLPAALAYLTSKAALGRDSDTDTASTAAAVALAYRQPLLAFLTSTSAPSLSQPDPTASHSLQTHAVPVLRLCLDFHPMKREEDEACKVLHCKLLPPKGWGLDPPEGCPGPEQQAELAHFLLKQV